MWCEMGGVCSNIYILNNSWYLVNLNIVPLFPAPFDIGLELSLNMVTPIFSYWIWGHYMPILETDW